MLMGQVSAFSSCIKLLRDLDKAARNYTLSLKESKEVLSKRKNSQNVSRSSLVLKDSKLMFMTTVVHQTFSVIPKISPAKIFQC